MPISNRKKELIHRIGRRYEEEKEKIKKEIEEGKKIKKAPPDV